MQVIRYNVMQSSRVGTCTQSGGCYSIKKKKSVGIKRVL